MQDLSRRLSEICQKLDLDKKKKRIDKISKLSEDPVFWQDTEKSTLYMKELSGLTKQIDKIKDIKELIRQENFQKAEKELEKMEVQVYFSQPHDGKGAILSIHSGQGGTEAMDWSEMLFRMYTRFIEDKGWSYELIEKIAGEEAGVKSVTISVPEYMAYGFLKGEQGTHRLVRQSPFNADKLRQTSFSLVEVLPILKGDEEVVISEDDLEWDFFRSGGKGGQNVNKVSTAVRVKHLPTGIVVESQEQRHQAQNRMTALNILKGKIWQMMQEQKAKEISELRGIYKKPSWGNQIRSYVLHPYHMIKDLRTGYEENNTRRVLDGDIEPFIISYLKKYSGVV